MSSMSSDADYQAAFAKWRDDAEAIDLVDFINTSRGGNLKRQGGEWVGPCPACGGQDRFSINPRERVFNCRGFGGGGYIDAVMHIDDCDFLTACEAMTGREAPERPKRRRDGARAASSKPKREETQARRDDGPAPSAPLNAPPADEGRSRRGRSPADFFASGDPIEGTHAAAYLNARGLAVSPGWTADMRFHPALPYLGYETPDAGEAVRLGEFPALLCAIRNVGGEIIAVHRTYLDPARPSKLTPPGDPGRNGAKKIVGKMGGGAIRLSPIAPVLVLGEGTETTRSAALLGIGGDGAAYWSAVSLGNLAGGCTGSINHPTIAKRKIPNGDPDPEKPGLILPPEIEDVIILGDGDSDPATTYATLLVAGRRFRADGRKVFVAMAPAGKDWNDVLRAEGAGA